MRTVPWTASLVIAGAPALAQINRNIIDTKVRVFGSNDPWADALTLQSPDLSTPIALEVGIFYQRIDGYYALATCIHNIVGSPFNGALGDAVDLAAFDNPDSPLHPDDRVGNGGAANKGGFNNGGQFQAVYHTGTSGVDANRFRIAAPGNAGDAVAGGISIHQAPASQLGTNILTDNPCFAYHFKLVLAGYNGGAARSVVIDTPKNRVNSYSGYQTSTSSTSTSMTFGDQGLIDHTDPATVNVSWAPSPGSISLLALAALACRRRRGTPA